MHLGQQPCASFGQCGLLVVVVARTWAYLSVDDYIRIEQRVNYRASIPSYPSRPCYLRLGQRLPCQMVDFPGAVSYVVRHRRKGLYHRVGSFSKPVLPVSSEGYQLRDQQWKSSMGVLLLMKLEDGVLVFCNEIQLSMSTTSFRRQERAWMH